MEIRPGPRPGDLGAVIRLHGEVYASEYGLDSSFEASVAGRLAGILAGGWPRENEGLWIVEADREPVGSITLSDEGDGLARLGHFVLLPAARGRGLGRQLVERVLAHARAAGYSRVELFTFGDLTTAARIYRGAGFVREGVVGREPWGREIEMERYLLEL
ncbi:MAG TPA: GNAT family N-acetyltransferase [Thermoleophilaceae bacterium]|nr:GNAT family N-acetyltransferase [Thermoleophilaceae bacterium]